MKKRRVILLLAMVLVITGAISVMVMIGEDSSNLNLVNATVNSTTALKETQVVEQTTTVKVNNNKTAGRSREGINFAKKKSDINLAADKHSSINVVWAKIKNADGYQIQYSTQSDFKKSKNKNAGKNKKQTKINVSKTKKNYYIRVRGYRKIGKDKYFSLWSPSVTVIRWNPKWEFAKFSKIHTGSAILYRSQGSKKKTVCVNAGHGTSGGERQKTLCHPDGSKKVTGGSTASGAVTATSINGGTSLNNGKIEASANLELSLITKKKLLKAGYNVLMVRETSDSRLDNIARTVMANNNAHYHISIHYDSSSSNKGAFYIGVPNVSSYKKMYPVSKNWKKHEKLGKGIVSKMKSLGVKVYGSGRMGIDLTQTSYSTIPSVDLEVGDKASNYSKKSLNKIATAISKGINN